MSGIPVLSVLGQGGVGKGFELHTEFLLLDRSDGEGRTTTGGTRSDAPSGLVCSNPAFDAGKADPKGRHCFLAWHPSVQCCQHAGA